MNDELRVRRLQTKEEKHRKCRSARTRETEKSGVMAPLPFWGSSPHRVILVEATDGFGQDGASVWLVISIDGLLNRETIYDSFTSHCKCD